MLMERGILVRWNDEKGFGFIQPDKSGARDVFIHISVLKKMARKPKVGDSILYQTEVQNDGKIKAVIASIEGVAVLAATPTSTTASRTPQVNRGNKSTNNTQSSFNRLISLLLLVALAGFGYKEFQQRQETIEEKPAAFSEIQSPRTVEPQFHCEAGKTHCSHMRSSAEATFYIQNCPNTQMDGDGDGIPCERQWCS
ncbi:MAG: excalibur calcium-binding domain-containing protein [Shewanella xiamenensis]